MSDAQLERTNVKIKDEPEASKAKYHPSKDGYYSANGEIIKFDGFLKVYLESVDDEDMSDEQEGLLPSLTVGESLGNEYISATQRFTKATI